MTWIEVERGDKWQGSNQGRYGVDVSAGSPYYDSVRPEWLSPGMAREFANELIAAADEADKKNNVMPDWKPKQGDTVLVTTGEKTEVWRRDG